MKVLIAVKEANKKESKIIMAKETKKIDTVKKLEKDGIKLSKNEKALVRKGDEIRKKSTGRGNFGKRSKKTIY